MSPTKNFQKYFEAVASAGAQLPLPEDGLFTFEAADLKPDIHVLSLLLVDSNSDTITVKSGDLSIDQHQKYSACFHWEPIKMQVRLYGKVQYIAANNISLSIESIEFWKRKAHRVHERDVYKKDGSTWKHERIYP
jgi:hypothetical protein